MWTPEGIRALLEENHPWPEKALSVHLWAHLWWDRKRRDFSAFYADLLTEDYIRNVDTTYNLAARPFLPPPASGIRASAIRAWRRLTTLRHPRLRHRRLEPANPRPLSPMRKVGFRRDDWSASPENSTSPRVFLKKSER